MTNFPFVSTLMLRSHFAIGKFGEAQLRAKLPKNLYWIQPNRKVLWNFKLVQDYLINGDGAEHQKLRESFLATLPKAA
ncbi:MAG: hypothetical protein SFT94_05895 [Pseudanabaenaceae cyanobacterium bins.68]|nr:hypothetical protein [Pseudanabaenaceae cyanobacterium bins.68]